MCFGCCCFTVAFHNRIFFESFFVVEAKLRTWAKTQTWFHILCFFKRQNSLQFKQKAMISSDDFCHKQKCFDFLCFENWVSNQSRASRTRKAERRIIAREFKWANQPPWLYVLFCFSVLPLDHNTVVAHNFAVKSDFFCDFFPVANFKMN